MCVSKWLAPRLFLYPKTLILYIFIYGSVLLRRDADSLLMLFATTNIDDHLVDIARSSSFLDSAGRNLRRKCATRRSVVFNDVAPRPSLRFRGGFHRSCCGRSYSLSLFSGIAGDGGGWIHFIKLLP